MRSHEMTLYGTGSSKGLGSSSLVHYLKSIHQIYHISKCLNPGKWHFPKPFAGVSVPEALHVPSLAKAS